LTNLNKARKKARSKVSSKNPEPQKAKTLKAQKPTTNLHKSKNIITRRKKMLNIAE